MIPNFRIDDVLQSINFSPAEQEAFAVRSPFEWFKLAAQPFEDRYVKLVIVAEGIDRNPEWVEFIKGHKKWEVQVHCWEHKVMKHMEEADLYKEIKMAKEKIEDTFNQRCTQFFPPKHYHSDNMWRATRDLGLSLMMERYIPDHYFKYRNIVDVYFHFWNQTQIEQVRRILDEHS